MITNIYSGDIVSFITSNLGETVLGRVEARPVRMENTSQSITDTQILDMNPANSDCRRTNAEGITSTDFLIPECSHSFRSDPPY